jgi:competence protein ComEC
VRLTLLDVGQGQAVLLEGPDGARVLLDGGGLWPGFDVGAAVTGPALAWNRPPRLDGVLLSHPDSDHWRGLEYVLRRFSVGWFASNGDRPRGEDGERYDEALAEWGGEPRVLTAGEVLPLGGGAALEVLHPAPGFAGKDNDRSLVLRLTWRGRGLALLPGDVERAGLLALLASGRDLRADVLVLPHHGAASSLSPELYRRAAPRLALASAGFLNYFGFPAALVTEALRAAGVPLRTTADAGALTVEWCAPDAAPRLGAARPVAVAAGP